MNVAEVKQDVTLRRVLIVDDDAPSRTIMRHVLSLHNFEIEEACDGLEADEMVDSRDFQLVIVDLRLPRLSGLDLIGRIREKHPNLPIIIVSGGGELEEAIEAIRHDVFFYFEKPIVNLDEFLRVIESALERERLIRENRAFQEELRELNLRLREKVVEQTREIAEMKDHLSHLFQVSPSILAARDIDEKLNIATEALITGKFFQRAKILLEPYVNQPIQVGWAAARKDETLPQKGLKGCYRKMTDLLRKENQHGGAHIFSEPRSSEDKETDDLVFVLVPLRGQDGRIIGIARLEEPVSESYPGEEILHLLELFMAQLALSIEEVNLERELEKSEEGYRTLVDNVSDLIFQLDLNGNITFVSRQSLDNLGYEWSELIGKAFRDLVTEEKRASVEDDMKSLLAKRGISHDFVIRHKDGRDLIMAVTANPLIELDKTIGILGIARNVTEKRRLESQVRDSEERYRALTENANDAIFLLDPETYQFIEVNLRAEELTGYSREELLTMTALDLRQPKYIPQAIERIEATKAAGKNRFEDAPLRRKDGREIYVDISAIVLEVGGRRIYQSIVRDITEQKQAEEALRESEARFRSITNTANDAIIMLDHNGHISYWNPAAEEIFGYTNQEAIGKELHQFLAPQKYYEAYHKGLKNFRKTGKGSAVGTTSELEAIRKDGTEFPIELSLSSIQVKGQWHAVGIARDITERKRTEEALRQRVMELQILSEIGDALQSAVDVHNVWAIILAGVTAGQGLGFNRAFILIYDEEEATLHGVAGIGPTSPDEATRIWSELSTQSVSLPDLIRNYQADFPSQQQTMAEYAKRLSMHVDEKAGVFYRAVFFKENAIIRNKEASDMVPEEFHKHYEVSSFAVVPMISRDTVLGVLLVDNFITKRSISDDDLRRLGVFANSAALSFERSRLRASLEVKLQELTAANRELKESRDKLVRTERLSAVGEVAASVAHEIRNPLTAIGGFARSVLNSLTPDDRNRARLQIIVDEVRRLESILTEILQFTRPTMPRFEATDLNGIILQTFGMMSEEIDEEFITVNKKLDPNLPAVWADSDQIRQVLLNLFRNAIHSMPDGGQLWVETTVQGGQIEMKVEDSGIGIPKANREKLFDAFFTTKPTGSGLGLTVSLQIARNHGGTIVVHSEEGKGSAFTVCFPLHKKSA